MDFLFQFTFFDWLMIYLVFGAVLLVARTLPDWDALNVRHDWQLLFLELAMWPLLVAGDLRRVWRALKLYWQRVRTRIKSLWTRLRGKPGRN